MDVPKVGKAAGNRGKGRPKGVPNRATAAKAAEIAASGMTPLDFLLHVYRNEGNDIALRVNAAKSAAPYVHPSLASVDMALTGHIQLGGVRPDDIEGK